MKKTRSFVDRILYPLVLLASVSLFAPSLVFDSVWYRLDSVHVYDTVVGQDPKMEIAGSVLRDHWGTYSVTIRRVAYDGNPDWLICQGFPDTPFEYRQGDYHTIKDKTLSWWLGGRDRLDKCWSEGMDQPGLYTANTCHFLLGPFGIKVARRCLLSNPFTILPPET